MYAYENSFAKINSDTAIARSEEIHSVETDSEVDSLNSLTVESFKETP